MQEKNTALYHPALEELRRQIRSSTTSMTSVPKPLKFLRPHYGKLKEIYDGMAPGENKVRKGSFMVFPINESVVNGNIFDGISTFFSVFVLTWCRCLP